MTRKFVIEYSLESNILSKELAEEWATEVRDEMREHLINSEKVELIGVTESDVLETS